VTHSVDHICANFLFMILLRVVEGTSTNPLRFPVYPKPLLLFNNVTTRRRGGFRLKSRYRKRKSRREARGNGLRLFTAQRECRISNMRCIAACRIIPVGMIPGSGF
jgi:hypothetical protein